MFTLQYGLGLRKCSGMVVTSVAWLSKEFEPWLSSARKLPHALRQVRSTTAQRQLKSEVHTSWINAGPGTIWPWQPGPRITCPPAASTAPA